MYIDCMLVSMYNLCLSFHGLDVSSGHTCGLRFWEIFFHCETKARKHRVYYLCIQHFSRSNELCVFFLRVYMLLCDRDYPIKLYNRLLLFKEEIEYDHGVTIIRRYKCHFFFLKSNHQMSPERKLHGYLLQTDKKRIKMWCSLAFFSIRV